MNLDLILYAANDNDRKLLRLYFESCGFQVRVALSGSDILGFIEQGFSDIILMDIFEGGKSVCCDLKTHPKYAKIPIILYKGKRHHRFHDDTNYANLIDNTKADYFFSGVFMNTEQLMTAIKSLIKKV